MITLKTLKWSNAFSYGPDNFIDLEASQLTQILGGNGNGKSSIPLILEEALYNKNSKNIKKASIPNRHIKDGYAIEVSFTSNSDEFVIEVTRKSTLKVKLWKNGEDISSHTATNTYKSIEEILGLDFKTFSQLIYQNSNASLQFLTATDTSRKKFLIDLLHLEEYLRLFDVFKEAARVSNIRLTEVQTKADTIRNWLENNILGDTTILPMLELENSSEEQRSSLSVLLIELENISQKNKKIQSNNKYKTMLNAIDIKALDKIDVTEKVSYDSLQSEAGRLKHVISSSVTMINKLGGLGLECPTCTQPIDQTFKDSILKQEELAKETAYKELEERVNTEIARIKNNNALYEQKVRTQKEWEDLWRNIDNSLPTTLVDRSELEADISTLRSVISEISKKAEAVTKENTERSKANTRIQVIQEQSDKFQLQLNEVSEVLIAEAALNSNLEILKKSFSTNGLLAYKIENLVKELETLTNTYLGELSDGRFAIEFVVVTDKLNVVITDDGEVIEIESLSTGELAKVNTSSLLAIRKLMSSISKSRLNILFLDEVVSFLDDFGKEKLVEVLLQEEGLNTYMVTHSWNHPLVSKINVIKENKISRLE